MSTILLNDIIGKGYATVYKKLHDVNCRYIAIKGSRASKKSKTVALFFILMLLEYPTLSGLAIRRYGVNLRDSCFQDLQWAIERLGLTSDFRCTKSPLEIVRISTEQKILFRGMDDGLKITSITVSKGVLGFVWIEEAFELKNDLEFNKLDFSIRGTMPKGYTPKFLITFNAWSEQSWLKSRFFDVEKTNIYATTTTYKCNEWLTDTDLQLFESLKKENPKRYAVEGLGEWGRAEGLIYTNVECQHLDVNSLINKHLHAIYGLDFGYTDPTAFIGGFIDTENKIIYICMELYLYHVTNLEIAKAIKDLGIKSEKIYCDSAEPKSIEELRRYGLNTVPAVKGADSVNYGIQKLQNFKIIYDESCTNFEHEILNYAWALGADGKPTDRPEHDFSHSMDALRYSCSGLKITNQKIASANLLYMRSKRR